MINVKADLADGLALGVVIGCMMLLEGSERVEREREREACKTQENTNLAEVHHR
jgi:hypothetical protein